MLMMQMQMSQSGQGGAEPGQAGPVQDNGYNQQLEQLRQQAMLNII